MFTNHATIKQIRATLIRELLKIYPEGESHSITSLIMDHVGFSFHSMIMNPDTIPDQKIQAQINEILKDIPTGKPIQYILGFTEFCDLKLEVNENALIPRPETEELVLKIVEKLSAPPSRIIDLGTGTGCIALALKKYYPEANVSAVEMSRPALNLAKKNGQAHQLEVDWIQGDMKNSDCLVPGISYDLIVSNPPYVPESEEKDMAKNVKSFEPPLALFVPDQNPLGFYRSIAAFTAGHLEKNGRLWLEIHEDRGIEVADELRKKGLQTIRIHRDIHEKERFIEAGWKAHGL